MKLSIASLAAVAVGATVLASASSAGAASILNGYGYGVGYDGAIALVANDSTSAYSDVVINGVDLGALAAGATSTWVALGDYEYGSNGPFDVSVTQFGKTFKGTFVDQYGDADCYCGPSQIGTLPNAAVPEPATWALMLMGFGGMGMMLRSPRKRAIAA